MLIAAVAGLFVVTFGVAYIYLFKKPDVDFMKTYGISPDNFPNGFLLGIAKITGQIKYGDKDFAWLVESIKVFEKPIEYKVASGAKVIESK